MYPLIKICPFRLRFENNTFIMTVDEHESDFFHFSLCLYPCINSFIGNITLKYVSLYDNLKRFIGFLIIERENSLYCPF